MKSTLKLLAFLVATNGVCSAASVAVSNLVDLNFTVSGADTALNSTFTAKIGFLAEGTVLTSSSDFAAINAAWTQAGNITFASGDAAGYNGYFSGQVTFTDAAGLAGKDIYIWITNGAEHNAVLRSLNVDFLADSAIPNANAIGIQASNIQTDFQLLLGTRQLAGPNGGNGGSIRLNTVPEPSAMLLGALGVVGLIRRRR